ncbi:MAG: RNA polymerase sigma factor [Treponema sp.]|jgi:RNA polymerase sigma factor (sigma-70 family)|nr:RNA polymerase sigma factor [Treponema sp.]
MPRNAVPRAIPQDAAPVIAPKGAVSGVFAAYRRRLENFVRLRVPALEDAEDIVQEIFYQFTRMDSLARPVEQTAAWLYRVARNMVSNRRSKKRDEPYPVEYDENGEAVFQDVADLLFDAEVTPETEYLRALVWEEIDAALAELPEDQRYMFEQTELLGIPVKEISRITGVPVNTLLSRKHYAVLRLRKRLRNLYAELAGNGG